MPETALIGEPNYLFTPTNQKDDLNELMCFEKKLLGFFDLVGFILSIWFGCFGSVDLGELVLFIFNNLL